jgi:hypothetical protein
MKILRTAGALLTALFLAISGPVHGDETVPQATVHSSKVEGLEITPGSLTVPITQRAIKLTAHCEKTVKWLVISGSKVESMEIPETKQLMVFPNAVPEQISVYAYTVLENGEPSEPALSVITIQGARPPPVDPTPPVDPPTPKPPPVDPPTPSGPNKLIVTFVVDNESPDIAKITKVVDSKEVVEGLKSRGCGRFVRDVGSPRLEALNLKKFVDAAGGAPVMIIQIYNPGQSNNGQVVFVGKIPSTVEELLAIVDKHIGGK